MLAFGDKGSIRGQRPNFRISAISIYMAISRLKLNEKSIGDGSSAPKCLLLEIRGQRPNFRISAISIYMAISTLKLNEKSIGDGPRAPKCLLLEIRGL
jgi:hypothetical protein